MKKLILIPSLLLMAGCARNMTSTDVKGQISVAVTSNAKATSYQDWHISDTNSDAIMADLTKKYFNKQVTEKDICQAFEEVPTSDLVVFENHIRTDESAFILKSCQAALKQKLDKYWKAELIKIDSRGEKPSMAPAPKGSDNSVRRFDEVVYVEKDLDNGNNYFVYGDLKKGQVALTFDDGPSGLYTELVLKALADGFYAIPHQSTVDPVSVL